MGSNAVNLLNRLSPGRLIGTVLGLSAALVVAGCGSTPTGQPSASPTPSGASGASVTVKTASVGSLGTVLVDGQGRTLYTLTSEAGGAITCTSASGCLKFWPEIDLGSGQTDGAQGAAQPSMLGTETGAASGQLITYNGWPLYMFSGDSAAGQAKGEGLKSFGGTWYALSASGSLVKSAASSPSSTSGVGGY